MVSTVVKKLNNALGSVGYVLESSPLKGSRILEQWVPAEAGGLSRKDVGGFVGSGCPGQRTVLS
jgi:hypothetical protein